MYRVALVGCGRIANRHAELLSDNHIDGAELVGVCDPISSKSKHIGAKFCVPYFNDAESMIDATNPDILVVLTESGNHARDVISLAKYKRHIIVEKPMSLRIEDANNMIKACEDNYIRLFIVKQNRFNRPIIQLRKALEQGRFGKLVLGTIRVRWCRTQSYYDESDWRGTWRMDGGVLTNQASHHLDMLTWMMGDVSKLYAISSTQLVDIEVEDTAVVSLKFTNGALGVIEATTAARPIDQEGSISIMGENGLVEIGGFAMNEIKTWQFTKSSSEDKDIVNLYSTNPPDVYGFGHKAYYQHVIQCLQDKSPTLVDGYEGRKTVQLLNAIYESIDTNNEIRNVYNTYNSKIGNG